MLAAISNAVFDAIGIRLRSAPFVLEKVLAGMKTAILVYSPFSR